MRRFQVVRSVNHVNILLEKGYRLVKIDRDRDNRDFLIFLFAYSEELKEELRKLNDVHYKY